MIALAHIGYGYWGRNLARNFAKLGVLKYVVDENVDLAAGACAELGALPASFEQAISDATIDAISIASPAEFHFAHARAALDAGKHVFVEKPLALSANDAAKLVKQAEERGLILMVGHLLQYHPAFQKILGLVVAGELGKVMYAYSNRLSLGKFRGEENVLWSFAPHDISMLLSVFGEEPCSVSAQGSIAFTPGVADFVTAQMHFPGGGSGHVQVSWMHPFKEQRLVLIGSNGMAVFEDSNPLWDEKLRLYRHKIDNSGRLPVPEKAEAELVPVDPGEPLLAECSHFIECLRKSSPVRTGGEEGLRVLKVLERMENALQANLVEREHMLRGLNG